jgi:hypothetical protein
MMQPMAAARFDKATQQIDPHILYAARNWSPLSARRSDGAGGRGIRRGAVVPWPALVVAAIVAMAVVIEEVGGIELRVAGPKAARSAMAYASALYARADTGVAARGR